MSTPAGSWPPRFSPLARWEHVEASAVQAHLRVVFGRWGRPQQLRVDNGFPWGSTGDLPTDLALWLFGLDIEVVWNPPRQPQRNGVVERYQGVGQCWAEPQTCASPAELQERLDRLDRLQRERYPYRHGRSRLEVFPALAHAGRPYSATWERRHWSLAPVLAHVAGYVLRRRVSQKGTVSLYERSHYVGTRYGGQVVYVQLDPEAVVWVFTDERGTQIRQKAAVELCRERIVSLNVSNHR